MNARAVTRLSADELEFLPAALEIVETPPSPLGLWLLRTICVLAVVGLAWSWFARVDVVAVAPGKIQPVGGVKIIQPLETGKVATILVENGQHVAGGDVLVELDHTQQAADEAGFAAALAGASAEKSRRVAEIAAVRGGQLAPLPAITFDPGIPPDVRAREAEVLNTDLGQLSAALAAIDAQRGEKQAELDALRATIVSEETLVATLQKRVDMQSQASDTGNGSRAAVIDAIEALQSQQTALTTQNGQIAQIGAAIAALGQEQQKTIEGFIGDSAQKMADASRQVDELQQKLASAHAQTEHMTLRSPVAGRIEGLSLSTIGQVVGSGQSLMHIVPDNQAIEVEAYVENQDIGFVSIGQPAIVKIDAFPFTRYGVVPAHLSKIGLDSIPEPDAILDQATPATPSLPNTANGAQPVRALVYPVTLTLDRPFVDVDGKPTPIVPGMTVAAEIRTGDRRIIDFLVSPLAKTASETGQER